MTKATKATNRKSEKSVSLLQGVRPFSKGSKPVEGRSVLWIWGAAGQITVGDFFKGKPRDAARCYDVISFLPTHWMPFPENWPLEGKNKVKKWAYALAKSGLGKKAG
jgi:hypothetical protein